ncbi:MAG: M64 family metallopeptidase, partial [Bacteroidales bacterium]|nr:M64 family metallopeptidase [Bacteroidales bacterium]
MKTLFFSVLCVIGLNLQAGFDDYFENKTLRIDYYHTGNNTMEIYSIDELIEEPYWGGSKVNLLDIFNYGKYKLLVYDTEKNTLIYSYSYNTLFQEWQTTNEAKTTYRTFSETVTIPFPKKKVKCEFHSRNRKGIYEKKFEYIVDPKNYFIVKERRQEYPKTTILQSGDPAAKVDIVVIPEGYTSSEMDKFIQDANTFATYLFNASPYKQNKNKFNIWAIKAPSKESGSDVPGQGIWKNTLVGSRFYTFDLDRYLMTSENKALRNVASNAPYDQIYIIANTSKYGGGAIYNHYAFSVNNNPYAEYIFTHEFGHSFAGLGDEYYDSETSYNDFYPLDVEPPDPNLTTLVDFDSKWKILVDKDTPIPTPNDPKYK